MYAFVRQAFLDPKSGSYKTSDWGDRREQLSGLEYGQIQLGLNSVLFGCKHGILHKIGVPEFAHLPMNCSPGLQQRERGARLTASVV